MCNLLSVNRVHWKCIKSARHFLMSKIELHDRINSYILSFFVLDLMDYFRIRNKYIYRVNIKFPDIDIFNLKRSYYHR